MSVCSLSRGLSAKGFRAHRNIGRLSGQSLPVIQRG